MVDRVALVVALRGQVVEVEADLRARSEDVDLPWAQAMRAEYEQARAVGRTALTWSVWRDGEVSLAGVAWVLGAVFVRFCEANGLIERRWIADDALHTALDAETAFYAADPSRNARDWLRDAFAHLAEFPAARGLVDPAHAPVWRAPLSADAAESILTFWRTQDADGALVWDLVDDTWDTRFLGDLYQDLSEHAKKKYALLQTPDFVEEFILDRTLTPALAAVDLRELRLIDPTCGSGHFLLGAFQRLHTAWLAEAPAMDTRVRIERVLESINGVDINPFAVAIARFRLMLAAMRACGARRLADAPGFRPRVAVADALIAGDPAVGTQTELDFGADDPDAVLAAHRYAAEDVDDYPGILARRQYHVVVGNPPYITVKDKALNEAYRRHYDMCKGKYALTVPFMELFFDLAVRGDSSGGAAGPGGHEKNAADRGGSGADGAGTAGHVAGWVGQITSNSFMKREFGSRLIENMLSGVDPLNPVDLLDVIDTSGAYIPGHGTPTVILIGRRQRPTGDTVHAVLGVRGEPGAPTDPQRGLVWSEIVGHIDDPDGFDGEYVTVTDLPRETLAHHPWSLSGGGAGDVKAMLDAAGVHTLVQLVDVVGVFGMTNADEVFLAPAKAFRRKQVEPSAHRRLVIGESIRDFDFGAGDDSVFLYEDRVLQRIEKYTGAFRWLWPTRTVTWARVTFSKVTYRAEGRTWWEWHQVTLDRLRTPLSIAFAFVATHNHFVLDRGGKVFNRSAPVIKLPAEAGLVEHWGLLGVLNSSTACFWLKQVSHNKGNGGIGGGIGDEDWEPRYEFTGTKLQDFPLPPSLPAGYGYVLDALAAEADAALPSGYLASLGDAPPTRSGLAASRVRWETLRAQMIAWQEELDWHTYALYGLIDESLTFCPEPPVPTDDPAWPSAALPQLPPVALGQRAFEIVLARRVAAGEESTEWFARHGSTPVTDIPADWPPTYREVVARRIAAMESNPSIRLLERPEFKRRWAHDSWDAMTTAALRGYILDRLERPELWRDAHGPRVQSVAGLADAVRHDGHIQAGIDVLYGPDADRVRVIAALLAEEAVPFLAAYRYKPSGLVKRAEWEAVWALQRREDAGERLDIPVPPKYAQADFRTAVYWKHRGKLDVPKERFIVYPGAESATDATGVYGWAGWDHADAAAALAGLLIARADGETWDTDRLVPLLAGLVELEPWLHQWHHHIDPEFGTSPADDITALLDARLATANLTRDDVTAWRPAEPRRGRRRGA